MIFAFFFADGSDKALLIQVLDACWENFRRADKDRSRKEAGTMFKKTMLATLEPLDDGNGALERCVALLDPIIEPPYKKFKQIPGAEDCSGTPGRGRRAYKAKTPPVVVAPPGYRLTPVEPAVAAPPGYKLVPVGVSPARAAVVTARITPPAGGKPPQVGISTLKPDIDYPTSHFTKPCAYCHHDRHCGDFCWKTYPELRDANGIG